MQQLAGADGVGVGDRDGAQAEGREVVAQLAGGPPVPAVYRVVDGFGEVGAGEDGVPEHLVDDVRIGGANHSPLC